MCLCQAALEAHKRNHWKYFLETSTATHACLSPRGPSQSQASLAYRARLCQERQGGNEAGKDGRRKGWGKKQRNTPLKTLRSRSLALHPGPLFPSCCCSMNGCHGFPTLPVWSLRDRNSLLFSMDSRDWHRGPESSPNVGMENVLCILLLAIEPVYIQQDWYSLKT